MPHQTVGILALLACMAWVAGRLFGVLAIDVLEAWMRWQRQRLVRQITRQTTRAIPALRVRALAMSEGS